jgi:phosphonate transport system permease protein
MIHTITIPPDAQMAPLMRGYAGALSAKRRQLVLGLALVVFAFLLACIGAEVDLAKFWVNLGNFSSYFYRISKLESGAAVWTDPVEWYWGLGRWLRLLGETLLMAYLGTATGFLGGFVACFLCSRNLMARAWVRFAVRRALEFCRTVPDIVFALIFVIAFGLGPLPGVLAIAIHTTGALGKLFSEVVESIDMKPVEGIAASGGTWVEQIRFGVLPQVLSNFASYGLLRFEVNVRGATVLGFVGAGGVGEELLIAIRKFYYSDVSAILLLVVVCVMLIDLTSEHIRHRLLTMEGGRR